MTLDNDSIVKELERYDKESKALRTNALHYMWYMRGGLSFDEAMQLSPQDREIVSKLIESNLQTTEKTILPFF